MAAQLPIILWLIAILLLAKKKQKLVLTHLSWICEPRVSTNNFSYRFLQMVDVP